MSEAPRVRFTGALRAVLFFSPLGLTVLSQAVDWSSREGFRLFFPGTLRASIALGLGMIVLVRIATTLVRSHARSDEAGSTGLVAWGVVVIAAAVISLQQQVWRGFLQEDYGLTALGCMLALMGFAFFLSWHGPESGVLVLFSGDVVAESATPLQPEYTRWSMLPAGLDWRVLIVLGLASMTVPHAMRRERERRPSAAFVIAIVVAALAQAIFQIESRPHAERLEADLGYLGVALLALSLWGARRAGASAEARRRAGLGCVVRDEELVLVPLGVASVARFAFELRLLAAGTNADPTMTPLTARALALTHAPYVVSCCAGAAAAVALKPWIEWAGADRAVAEEAA